MMEIRITTELVEWVQERLDIDADEAQNFAEEFAGMLYFSGGFAREEMTDKLKQSAPAMLAALEALTSFVLHIPGDEDFSGWRNARPEVVAARAAIAEARGEAG